MNAAALVARMAPARAALRERWRALSLRERQGISVALTALALLLAWALAVAPAWRLVRSTPQQIEALELEWQQMQTLAAEARLLRGATPVPPAQAAAALTAATTRLGDKAKLNLQADRAVLVVQGASGDELSAWLAEVRVGARARAIEANLSQSGPGAYNGNLVVALATGGPR